MTRLVVTCEHATNAVPRELGDLGLPADVLASHRGWDPGALPIAQAIAQAFRAPLFAGEWSRLVVDLNRSPDHAHVVRRSVDGRVIEGNRLSREQRAERVACYWASYRQAAEAKIRALVVRGPVLHLSVHSFTGQLHGVVRRNHIGLLHDPARPREVAFCDALKVPLVAAGLVVRRNFPYFGNTNGFTNWLRRRLPAARYLGIEIECNQVVSCTRAGQQRLAAALVQALREVLAR